MDSDTALCFKERCLRYNIVFRLYTWNCSLTITLCLLLLYHDDHCWRLYCPLIGQFLRSSPLIGRASGHWLGQLGPLRPLEALLTRPSPRPRCSHRLNILQELGQPVLGALVILETVCECVILELIRQTLAQSLTGPGVIRQTKVTANDVLQKPLARFLAQLYHHLSENHCNVRKSVVSLADVVEASLVQEDLLQDEGGHRLAQL